MPDALALYNACVSRGTSPTLTWYGPDGRMELSGKVVANHLAKIAGYLCDEIWLEESETVVLALPAHWKQVLWGLGAMLAGGQVQVGSAREAAVAITDTPESVQAREVLALDLGPLALSWTGAPLPGGVHDASAEVMGSPDALLDSSRHAASNFSQWAEMGALPSSAERLLIASSDPQSVLACASFQLGRGGLVVVAEGDPVVIANTEGAQVAHLTHN